jgi:hypothetical protein
VQTSFEGSSYDPSTDVNDAALAKREDLAAALVPYFVAGLHNHERCVWVTAEPLCAEAAAAELLLAGREHPVGHGPRTARPPRPRPHVRQQPAPAAR